MSAEIARDMLMQNISKWHHMSSSATIYNPLFRSIGKSVSAVTQWCLTLCDPMACSMPGFPVHHQFQELAQTHVHRVGDAT